MKTTLTIEQSAELIKRGVSRRKASATYVGRWEHSSEGSFADPDSVEPLFTLTDLLSLLPQADRDLGGITIGFDVERGKWASTYESLRWIAREDELIDSFYKLTLHLLNTHVKLD